MSEKDIENPMLSLLNELKNEKKESWKNIGRGFASGDMVKELLQGKVEASLSLIELLTQRLGASLDSFEIIVSNKDFEEILFREEIENDIFAGHKAEAEEKLNRLDISKQYVLMYYYRLKALKEYMLDKDFIQCEKTLKKAVDISLDGEYESEIPSLLLSEIETENFIALAKMQYLNGADYESTLKKVYIYYEYIKGHFEEEEERSKLLAKCIWLIARILNDHKFHEEAAYHCLKAIDLLGKWNQFYFMEPLLEQMGKAYSGMGVSDGKNVWKLALESFKECESELKLDIPPQDIVIRNYSLKELILDRDVVSHLRLNKGMTQEGLAAGIFSSAKPISDFERGKTSMTRKNLLKVLEKLGSNKQIWNSYYSYSNYKLQNEKTNLSLLLSKGFYEEISRRLDRIESLTEYKEIKDDGDLKMLRKIVNVRLKKEKPNELIEIERQYLGDFLASNNNKKRIPYRLDSIVFNNYMQNSRKISHNDDELFIQSLENLMSSIDECMGGAKYRYRTYGSLLQRHLTTTNSYDDIKKLFKMDICHGKTCGFLSSIYRMELKFDNEGNRKKTLLLAKAMLYYSFLYFKKSTYDTYYSFLKNEFGINIPCCERHRYRRPQSEDWDNWSIRLPLS